MFKNVDLKLGSFNHSTEQSQKFGNFGTFENRGGNVYSFDEKKPSLTLGSGRSVYFSNPAISKEQTDSGTNLHRPSTQPHSQRRNINV